MNAPFTFSEWDRVNVCAGSAALPRDPEVPDSSRDDGNARHDFLYNVGKNGDVTEALQKLPTDQRVGCSSIDLDDMPIGPGWCQELAMAINTEDGSAVAVGEKIGRAYPDMGPHFVLGTADTVSGTEQPDLSWSAPDVPLVAWDFKGWWSKITPPAAVNRQLRAQLIAGMGIANGAEVNWDDPPMGVLAEGGLIHLDKDGRTKRDGPVRFDVMDLGASLAELRRDVQRAWDAVGLVQIGKRPQLKEGPHCGYCPSIMHCPAKEHLRRDLAPVATALHPVQAVMMARIKEDPGGVREWAKHAEKFVDAVKSQLAQHAINTGGFKLSNGKMYGPHPVKRGGPDGDRLFLTLLDLPEWGVEPAKLAVTMDGTKEGIKRAARWAAGKGITKTIVDGERLIEELLRAKAGGWWEKTTVTVGEYDTEEKKP